MVQQKTKVGKKMPRRRGKTSESSELHSKMHSNKLHSEVREPVCEKNEVKEQKSQCCVLLIMQQINNAFKMAT